MYPETDVRFVQIRLDDYRHAARCVNVHDDLLAVAEKAEEFFRDPQAFTPTVGKKFCTLIRATIAKAKETP